MRFPRAPVFRLYPKPMTCPSHKRCAVVIMFRYTYARRRAWRFLILEVTRVEYKVENFPKRPLTHEHHLTSAYVVMSTKILRSRHQSLEKIDSTQKKTLHFSVYSGTIVLASVFHRGEKIWTPLNRTNMRTRYVWKRLNRSMCTHVSILDFNRVIVEIHRAEWGDTVGKSNNLVLLTMCLRYISCRRRGYALA